MRGHCNSNYVLCQIRRQHADSTRQKTYKRGEKANKTRVDGFGGLKAFCRPYHIIYVKCISIKKEPYGSFFDIKYIEGEAFKKYAEENLVS